MTDISSIRPHADSQLTSVAPLAPYPSALANGHSGFDAQDAQDEYTIKCICGFQDDDGNTVLCEKCNTWQHIACYYSTEKVPEIHECSDCLPRRLDASAARERQRALRDLGNISDKKVRKPAPKSHKKKGKDSVSTLHLNGWANDKNDHFTQDRKSGSPRDQPPTKRHKSSHKPSPSVPSITNAPSLAPSRKRAGSALINGQSPLKSPPTPQSNGYPGDYFSPEFLKLYRGEEHTDMSENCYEDIQMPKDLVEWLEDPETLAEVTGGGKPQDVFQRLGSSIEELDNCAPPIKKHVHEDTETDVKGSDLHPMWQWLTVEQFVNEGNYIGELRGRLERKERYVSDPSNRWQTLRHPEPFVFIPPYLPLVIDTRKEGTLMRYVRRSCDPNVELRTFIADHKYHFCFISLRDIQAGEVLTVRWDLDADIARHVRQQTENGNVAEKGIHTMETLSRWVAGALANFGGCACGREAVDCLLERAHRRDSQYTVPDGRRKSKKNKKQQISPISTGHATNSRAGSEAMHRMDLDDENADIRSASSSSRSKHVSRDNTPMTAHSLADGNGTSEPTDRETRKMLAAIQKAEQESEQIHGNKRKKRNSGGSTLNTPSVSSSKQLGHAEPSPPIRRTVANRKVQKKPTAPRAKPRPPYHDQEVQTDATMSERRVVPFKSFVSPARALLTRAKEERLRREVRSKSRAASENKSNPPSPASASSHSKATSSSTQDSKSSTSSAGQDVPMQEDIEMNDADAETDPIPVEVGSNEEPRMQIDPEPQLQTSHPQIQPPPPPWEPKSEDPPNNNEPPHTSPHRPSDLHVELPPTPDFSPQGISTTSLTATPGSIGPLTGPSPILSPSVSSQPPILSPSVSNAVAPSPARKKLSLSDYTSRKAKAQAAVVANKVPEVPSSQSDTAIESSSLSPSIMETSKDVEMKDAASPAEHTSTEMAPPKAPASHPPPPLFSA